MEEKIIETKDDTLKRINEQQNKIKRIALNILEQCKGENLTIYEFECVIDNVKYHVNHTTRL